MSGWILHKAYLDFRKNTWDELAHRIEKHPQALIVHLGHELQNTNYFFLFPQHIPEDEKVKMALLKLY